MVIFLPSANSMVLVITFGNISSNLLYYKIGSSTSLKSASVEIQNYTDEQAGFVSDQTRLV
jgi:hypothetical protein